MKTTRTKPYSVGLVLVLLLLIAAYGLGECQGRQEATHPPPSRWDPH